MLKLCQLIATFWVDWVMVRALGALEIVAAPACTVPPTGRAKPSDTRVRLREPASAVVRKRLGWPRWLSTPKRWWARGFWRLGERFISSRFCEEASRTVDEGCLDL